MAVLQNSLLMEKKTVESKALGQKIIDLGRKTFQIPNMFTYTWSRTNSGYAARPDLVSNIVYGTDIYGDVIAKANGWGNPLEFPDDDIVFVPDPMDIYKFFYTVPDETAQNSPNKPTPKKPFEPRKPSEAVVGDTRFKIDSTRKIVIY